MDLREVPVQPASLSDEHLDSQNIDTGRHRLVVLGSMDEFIALVKMAKGRGYYVIVCDGYPDGPAKRHADKSYDIDVRDTDAVAQMCKREKADGIIASFSDLLAQCLVDIAAKAGLPTYCTPEKMVYLREKPLMKKMFEELGVPSAKAVRIRRETLRSDLAEVGFPCVIKPANGYGSRGVYFVHDAEEVAQKFDETASYSDFDFIVAEPVYSGHEINLMSWILDGEPCILSAADRETVHQFEGVVPHVCRIVYPSLLTEAVYGEAKDALRKVAKYVGIETGPLCMQFFYSKEKGMQVCEVAGRIFGYEHELLEYAGNLSIEELLLNYVYDHDAMRAQLEGHDPRTFKQASAGLYFHGSEEAIASIDGIEDVRAMDGVQEVICYYNEGDKISHGVGAKPYVVRVFLKADARDEVDGLSKRIFDTIGVTGEGGQSLLYDCRLADYSDLR